MHELTSPNNKLLYLPQKYLAMTFLSLWHSYHQFFPFDHRKERTVYRKDICVIIVNRFFRVGCLNFLNVNRSRKFAKPSVISNPCLFVAFAARSSVFISTACLSSNDLTSQKTVPIRFHSRCRRRRRRLEHANVRKQCETSRFVCVRNAGTSRPCTPAGTGDRK